MSGVSEYLRVAREEVGDVLVDRVDVDDHLRSAEGGVGAGVLTALIDGVGGFSGGLAVMPDWVVTTNLMLAVATPTHAGPLRLEASNLRRGKSSVVTSVRVLDEGAAGAVAATALMSSAVLHPGPADRVFSRPLVMPAPERREGAPPVAEFFGVTEGADGTTQLDVVDRLRNSWGVLHGGATGVLIEAAARRAAPGTVSDMVVQFVSPARVGPVVADVRRVGSRGPDTLLRVGVHDLGRDGRLTALASVVVTVTLS